MSQLDYKANMDRGLEGLPADANALDGISRVIEGSVAGFGRALQLGTDKDKQVKAAAAGMTLAQFQGLIQYRPLVDGEILDKSVQTLLRKGRMYVTATEIVEPGDSVYVVLAAGVHAAGDIGRLVKTADGANTLDISSVCSWHEGSQIGGLAVVDLNLV